ncbi:MAG: hypothetical protein P8Y71_20135 [Pseudolabrys sp.]
MQKAWPRNLCRFTHPLNADLFKDHIVGPNAHHGGHLVSDKPMGHSALGV